MACVEAEKKKANEQVYIVSVSRKKIKRKIKKGGRKNGEGGRRERRKKKWKVK